MVTRSAHPTIRQESNNSALTQFIFRFRRLRCRTGQITLFMMSTRSAGTSPVAGLHPRRDEQMPNI